MGFNIFYITYCSALLFVLLIEVTHSHRYNRYRRQYSNINPLILSPETDPYSSSIKHFGLKTSLPINDEEPQALKAYSCSLMACRPEDHQLSPVCACNFNTGNVVSFKDQCDVLKHNCRFDTNFRIILNEICPWEFQSRRDNSQMEFDYSDPKYYN